MQMNTSNPCYSKQCTWVEDMKNEANRCRAAYTPHNSFFEPNAATHVFDHYGHQHSFHNFLQSRKHPKQPSSPSCIIQPATLHFEEQDWEDQKSGIQENTSQLTADEENQSIIPGTPPVPTTQNNKVTPEQQTNNNLGESSTNTIT